MKNKLVRLSIGIPVYNEGRNIKKLLQSLCVQIEKDYVIHEVIVVSDGSTDATIAQVREVKDKRITLVTHKSRIGKTMRVNEICQYATGDFLLLIDADITIPEKSVFQKIVQEIRSSKSGLFAINVQPLSASNHFARALNTSIYLQTIVRKNWNNGNNYLAFKGCFLILSNAFAKSVRIPPTLVNNDAFLYFAAKFKGFHPTYLPKHTIYYKSPTNLRDHMKQSSRFTVSKLELETLFARSLNHEYTIPKTTLLVACLQTVLKDPTHFFLYIGILGITKLRKEKVSATWAQVVSTK